MNLFKKILNFYICGFKDMKLGKTLWLVILIKLCIMFLLLKLFIFNQTLNTKFDSDKERSDFVYKNLTKD
ncbi:DUF4492 domain-containing protein [Campylobacter geochelonis]|uniref:DUF4492 domain-containing protein n=1 Tax=Campylobacter geochelonis TaxID=1780362 RepID=UPI00094DD564|nr:DUF4492 domain-containing protein [Campylobacter geochelonis]QKF70419.1 DUF4492 domain-containing protein [Campylobacter geochelonis]